MEEEDADWTPEKAAVPVRAAKPRATKKAKIEASPELPDKAPPAAAAEIEIEIKTKFPVARIKRIMQADEEVGKVAQVTPHVVCMLRFPYPCGYETAPLRLEQNIS